MSYLKRLRDFYMGNNPTGDNLFEIWERGAASGDSVTPSTFSPQYREWMCGVLDGLLKEGNGGLLSVGCGNAVIEAELQRAGYRVLAVDALDEAVEFARSKGLDAVRADVLQWSPPPERWTVVYADGLLGHLYDPANGLLPVFKSLRSWLVPGAGTLVVSNDRTSNVDGAEEAPGVPGFYWLSESLLRDQAEEAGFQDLSITTFTYQRPVSGDRVRVVLTARA